MSNQNEAEKFAQYRRKSISEMRPYIEGEFLDSKVSISEADKANGSPKSGDMIARNPKNHDDQWLVAKDYFQDNLEPIHATRIAAVELPDEPLTFHPDAVSQGMTVMKRNNNGEYVKYEAFCDYRDAAKSRIEQLEREVERLKSELECIKTESK